MARAHARVEPVLQPLRDRVLFLKHNLNARALGALTKELGTVRPVSTAGRRHAAVDRRGRPFIADMERDEAGEGRIR